MRMKVHGATRVLFIVSLVTLAVAAFSFIVRTLWNWLMPPIFGLHAVTYWQALGLLVLSKILFGGFRGRPGFGSRWGARMIRHWDDMTPEEREKFRARLRGGYGPFGSPAAEPNAESARQGDPE